MTQSARCVQAGPLSWEKGTSRSRCTFSHACHPLLTLLFLPWESTPACKPHLPADGNLGRKGNTE